MGQQQLLLIVLGVIIVGIAVVVGINVFTASSVQANRDGLIADLTNLASMAQQFYRKPGALGGGDNSFANWDVPENLKTTGNGTYARTITGGGTGVTIVGTGNETGDNGSSAVLVTMYVNSTSIDSTIIGN